MVDFLNEIIPKEFYVQLDSYKILQLHHIDHLYGYTFDRIEKIIKPLPIGIIVHYTLAEALYRRKKKDLYYVDFGRGKYSLLEWLSKFYNNITIEMIKEQLQLKVGNRER